MRELERETQGDFTNYMRMEPGMLHELLQRLAPRLTKMDTHYRRALKPVSRFECVSGLSVYPVEIRSVDNLSSSEDCSTDYCQPV